MNSEKINGYGAILRFITPILVTVMLFILSIMRTDILTIKLETKENFNKLEKGSKENFDSLIGQFNNHLSYHQKLDKEIYQRLTRIEGKIK